MLWEAVDSTVALTTRFGFTDASHASTWFGETLSEAWDLHIDSCDRLVISASKLLAWLTVDGKGYVAKSAVDTALFERLADIDALIAWLDGEGIPVAAPIAATNGQLRVDRGDFSVGLYPLVAGNLLDVDDVAQVDAAGRMLARIHRALKTYPRGFADGPSSEEHQLVHGDFRSANILQNDSGITAILDFDEASYRSRAAELGQSAVLLGTRYHNWRPTTPATREVFASAYNEVSPLTSAERDEFGRVVLAVLEHFGWE